jgi:hypothetical protein
VELHVLFPAIPLPPPFFPISSIPSISPGENFRILMTVWNKSEYQLQEKTLGIDDDR